jgi:hypothetical protein
MGESPKNYRLSKRQTIEKYYKDLYGDDAAAPEENGRCLLPISPVLLGTRRSGYRQRTMPHFMVAPNRPRKNNANGSEGGRGGSINEKSTREEEIRRVCCDKQSNAVNQLDNYIFTLPLLYIKVCLVLCCYYLSVREHSSLFVPYKNVIELIKLSSIVYIH